MNFLKKYRFFGIVFIFAFLNSSCSSMQTVKWENMFHELEDLHVEDTTLYKNSPYSQFIKKTFPKNWQQKIPESSPHYLNILETGEEALLARVHWIRLAKKMILIQTFIWDGDESGRYIINELINAAKRGVKVKILIDALGATNDRNLLAYFADAHPNMDIKFYNPSADSIDASALQMIGEFAFRLDGMNKRMHNKTIIVDDQMVIMGGRNFQNDYFDRNRYRNFKDRDVLAIGPIVKKVTKSFMEYWAFYQSISARDLTDVGPIMASKSYQDKIKPEHFEFGELFADIESRVMDKKFIKSNFIDAAFLVNKVVFNVDMAGKNNVRGLSNSGRASDELMTLLKRAKQELIFQTPYLVVDGYLLKGLKKIRKKNPHLDVLISTNSLAATDHITAYSQSFKQKSIFVDDLKFRIFELRPVPDDIAKMVPNYSLYKEEFFPTADESIIEGVMQPIMLPQKKRYTCIHAKSIVVDDEIAWIGSFNLDPRSAHLNTELGLIVWDHAFAQKLRSLIKRDMKKGNSWVVGRKPGIPIVKQVNMIIDKAMAQLPIGDVWPFEHISLYELKEDGKEMPFYSSDFNKNYKNVGSFPEVPLTKGQIQTILLKAFIGIAKPLI